MRVSEAMTRDVRVVNPEQNICDVARIMAECDVGSVPVGENDRLVGMVTDRDIAVRAVAQGRSLESTRVRDVMTQDVKYCFEDEDIAHVARNMGDIQVHRLPVVNADKRLVGIVSLADIAMCEGAEMAGQAVAGISTPTGSSGPTTGSSWSSHQQQQQPSSGSSGSSQQQQQPGSTHQQSAGAGGISRQHQQQPSGSSSQSGMSQPQGPSSMQQSEQSSGSQRPMGSQQSSGTQQSSGPQSSRSRGEE